MKNRKYNKKLWKETNPLVPKIRKPAMQKASTNNNKHWDQEMPRATTVMAQWLFLILLRIHKQNK